MIDLLNRVFHIKEDDPVESVRKKLASGIEHLVDYHKDVIPYIGKVYHEMRLQDLSPSESQEMVQSLLKTEKVPSELQRFIQEKIEGNIMNGQITEAENAINCIVAFCQDSGVWVAGTPAQVFSGATLISKGQMGLGLQRLKEGKQALLASGNMLNFLQSEYIPGKVFSMIAMGSEPISLSKISKRNL